MSIIFQLSNILVIIILMGAPVLITFLLLKRLGKGKNNEDYLLEKIRELERRIEELEKEIYDISEIES